MEKYDDPKYIKENDLETGWEVINCKEVYLKVVGQ